MENHKATKSAFNVGPSSADDGTFMWYLGPLSPRQLKTPLAKLGPL